VQYDMRVGYISACRTLPLGFVGGLAGLIAGGPQCLAADPPPHARARGMKKSRAPHPVNVFVGPGPCKRGERVVAGGMFVESRADVDARVAISDPEDLRDRVVIRRIPRGILLTEDYVQPSRWWPRKGCSYVRPC
jgi:hypothetical protein